MILQKSFIASSRYLAFLHLMASSIQSSQGTISSNMTTCLEKSDVKIKSGQSVILVMETSSASLSRPDKGDVETY